MATVDEVRRARGDALIHFDMGHESSDEIRRLAECFDILGPGDKYAPAIATLFVEAAVADRAFQVVLDRKEDLLSVETEHTAPVGLRLRTALGDAGVPGVWPDLIHKAESMRFKSAEGAFVCLRGARWCAWNGRMEKAESLFRLAMKLSSEAGLDLDAENALWSLSVVHSLGNSFKEYFETNRTALSIEGSRSYAITNTRTQQWSYQYLANGELPNAHLWTRFRLLESIRSGCLMDQLESYRILSRIYHQSGEILIALECAILGGSQQLVKELAPEVNEWPEFIVDMVHSEALWVRKSACETIECVGDIAPPEVARKLFSELVHRLLNHSDSARMVPMLLRALSPILLEASDPDIEQLMPVLERLAPREPGKYRLTDPGVLALVARLYRFRPRYRHQAAMIFAEMAIDSQSYEWSRALDFCGDDTDELAEAFQRLAERDSLEMARPLSELGHVTASTRPIWSERLQSVVDHPLGQRSEHSIAPSYDVPADFLREQEVAVVDQYVAKLIAIGCDNSELVLNRALALEALANVTGVLSSDEKRRTFRRVR